MILLFGFIFYFVAATIGISAGYHRYFTHKSFKTNPFIEIIMLFFGLLCGGRSAITWCGVHRMHHAESDTEKDPHSPKFKGIFKVLFSLWKVKYIPPRYLKDLIKNPRVVWFHKYGKILHIFYSILLLVIGIQSFIIFAFIPFIFSWIFYGILNYATHRHSEPVDIPYLSIVAPGEGWHRQHHLYPGSQQLNKFDHVGWIIKNILANDTKRLTRTSFAAKFSNQNSGSARS
jgi:stearoyl-CoA desaturase (delta-9 desaturase)